VFDTFQDVPVTLRMASPDTPRLFFDPSELEVTGKRLLSDYEYIFQLFGHGCENEEELLEKLWSFYETYGYQYEFLHFILKKAAERTSFPEEFLREDTVATRLMRINFFSNGGKYLDEVIVPTIQGLIDRDEDLSTMEEIVELASSFIDHLISSIERCPMAIREALYAWNKLIEKNFDRFQIEPLGFITSTFFLRFIIPSLAQPYEFYLLPERVPDRFQRILLRLAKLLKNLADKNQFSPYDEDYDLKSKFVEEHHPRITNFMLRLMVRSKVDRIVPDAQVFKTRRIKELIATIKQVQEQKELIEKEHQELKDLEAEVSSGEVLPRFRRREKKVNK